MRTDRVLQVADLVGRPGASRPLALAFGVPDDVELALAQVVGPLRLDGVVESVVEGILVRATLQATLLVACARCLREFTEAVAVPVVELFSDPSAGEVEAGYAIRGRAIDLDTLVRDALVPAVPLQPRCRPDCAGLCPICGTDRNQAACACHETRFDAHWSALEALRLPDGP
jgi:uncharacterized protein